MMEFWLISLFVVGSAAACGGLLLSGYAVLLSARGARETRRGDRRLAELARMSHLASAQFWKQNKRFWQENERFWERSDRRWADHEVLMRMVLERTDRPDPEQGNA